MEQEKLQQIAKLRAERDVIDAQIDLVKARIANNSTYWLNEEQKDFVTTKLTELHAQRLEIGEKLWEFRSRGLEYEK